MFALRLVVLLFLVAYGWGMGQEPPHNLNPFGTFIAMSFFATAPALYLLPTFEAWKNSHPSLTSVALLNIFLGWTLLGWVAALVWAFKTTTAVTPAPIPAHDPAPASRTHKRCPYCAEEVLAEAIKCKHCGSDLMAEAAAKP